MQEQRTVVEGNGAGARLADSYPVHFSSSEGEEKDGTLGTGCLCNADELLRH